MFTEVLSNLSGLFALVAASAAVVDPISTLYGLLAGTYGTAAAAVSRNNHRMLGRCYVVSALLHGLISACHHYHF